MATREENLKKINDELEKLSDEQLEKVAGGHELYQTADDSRFLNVLLQGTKYHHCDRYGATRLFFDDAANDDVAAAWASLGIKSESGFCESDRYYLNGQIINQTQAWDYAEKLVGRHLSRTDWDW